MKKSHHLSVLNQYALFIALLVATSSLTIAKEKNYQIVNSPFSVDLNEVKQPIFFSHRMSDSNIKISASSENRVEVQLAQINRSNKADGQAFLRINPQTGDVSLRTTGDIKDSNLHIILPASTSISIQSSDGDIEIDGISGDVQCSSSDGNIRLTNLTGGISAESSDGNMLLSMEKIESKNPVSLSTQDGNIDLHIPKFANANLLVSVIDGNISYNLSGTIKISNPKTTENTKNKQWERIFSADQTQIQTGKGPTKQSFQLSALDGNIRISNQ